jgi:superfamily II DNA/RNA helicase
VIEEGERIISPLLSTNMSWDDKEFNFSPELKKAIKDGMNWENPSIIQASAIPLIVNPDKNSGKYKNLIAQ